MRDKCRTNKKRYKRGKSRAYRRKISLTALLIVLVIGSIFGMMKIGWEIMPDGTAKQQNTQDDINSNIDVTDLNSPYAILINASSGKTVAEHNSQERIYPASMTKIMTALVAIEHTKDLEQTVELSYDVFTGLYQENASMAGFEPGEEVKLKDLIYGMLLPSGAECCIAYADQVAGSETAFVKLMNQKAKELGMTGTQFKNTTGLDQKGHYSTVQDIAVLLQYALKNQDFREAFTSSRYHTEGEVPHTLESTLFKKLDNRSVAGGEILGGKTGYTGAAGLCLASLATVDGKEYILVTAKAKGDHRTEQYNIVDAVNTYSKISKID